MSGAVRDADVVVSILPSNPHVLDVYMGTEGVLSAAKPGALLIDASTIDPSVAKQVGSAALVLIVTHQRGRVRKNSTP